MIELKVAFEKFVPIQNQSSRSQIETHEKFSEVLDNLKHNRPADYDEDLIRNEDTRVMTQILSDGSTLITIFDAEGRVISQSKTHAAKSDPDAKIIETRSESRFGLEELSSQNFFNAKFFS